MKTLYRILFEERDDYGVAYAREKQGIFYLPEVGLVNDWEPRSLDLREGGFPDYLASDLGCRLCSKRLKNVLQDNALPEDVLQWLEVRVYQGAEYRIYYILHFPDPPDVLNVEQTLYVSADSDLVVKPVFTESAIGGHGVFSYPGSGELCLLVSSKVKKAIEAAGCTGIEFSRALIEADQEGPRSNGIIGGE